MKTNFLLAFSLLLVCFSWQSCSEDNENGDVSSSYAPKSIIGKTLILYNSNGSIKLSADHLNSTGVSINNVTVDYTKYPPLYTYSANAENSGVYHLESRKKVYIPYYQDYTYSKFLFDVNMTFTSSHGGNYKGTQTNGEGTVSTIAGIFSLYTTGEIPPDLEEGKEDEKDEEDDTSIDKIQLSTPDFSNITDKTAVIEGFIVGDEKQIEERGVCYSTLPNPTIENSHQMANTNNINIKLINLSASTTYYVCLYVKINGLFKYGNVNSFATKAVVDSGDYENSTMQAIVSSVEEFEGRHSIYVYGKYADPGTSNYLKVGFCAATTPKPKITDITISEGIENPNSNSVRTISEVKGGTTYYIRPYHVKNGEITYYRSASVQTLGKDIKLSVRIQDDHQFGHISYDIMPEGTYQLAASFWSISGIRETELGYVTNSSGSKSFSVGTYLWENYLDCTVSLTCLETKIAYRYKVRLGKVYGY